MVDPLGASDRMRMFGLGSGLDIDSIVSKLMSAEQIPLDKMNQQKQTLQWQQDDYRSMNSSLLDLYNSTFDMTLQSSYLAKTAVSSNGSLVTATASTSAGNSSFSITGGTLAQAAHMTSVALTNFDPSKSLWENRGYLAGGSGFSFTKNTTGTETDKAVPADGTTFNIGNPFILSTGFPGTIDVEDATGTTSTSYKVYFDQKSYDADKTNTDKVLINSTTGDMTFSQKLLANETIKIASYSYATGIDLSTTISAADSTGNVTKKDFSFKADQSLNDVIDQINNSGLNVSAFFGTGSNQLSITSKSTGQLNTSGKDIEVSGTFFNTNLGFPSTGVNGGDATLVVNDVTMKSHTNKFSINGVTFNLNSDIPINTTVSVNITDDTSAIFDKIKSWVDKYNDTIKTINDKVSETRYRDYPPLTDAQKKGMNDDDIKLWNNKAMSGMLASDRILPSGLTQMRNDIYTAVNSISGSSYNQLAKIGITTSSDFTENGKLEIDESKLKAAIAADPTSIMDLFTNTGVLDGGKDPVYANEGIMQRLQTTIQNTMNSVYQEAGKPTYTYNQYYLGKSMHELDNRISDMQTHLQDVENRYYKQYSAMEEAIQASNNQGSMLMSSFGGGSSQS